MSPPLALAVENLAIRRGGRAVLRDLSFEVGAGEALVVTGRNGAGKSTLIAAIAGRVRPERGSIRVSGIGDASPAEQLHVVGHRDGLKPALTAAENLRFAASLLGQPRLAPGEALARVGLDRAAHLPVAFLSAGQRRRVALARLLVAHRPVWLLDEPLTALDRDGRALVVSLVVDHVAAGGLALASSHAPLALAAARELALDELSPVPEAPNELRSATDHGTPNTARAV